MRWLLLAVLVCASPATLQAQKVCTPFLEGYATEYVEVILKDHVKFTARKVYVDPVLWALLDAEQKEHLTHTLGVYQNCIWVPANVTEFGKPVKKLDSFKVTVVDKQSGSTLSSIGIFRGYKVH